MHYRVNSTDREYMGLIEADMKVDKVANMEVDMVADMEVDMMA